MTEIKPGQVYLARNQGRTITPQEIKVRVVWCDGENVHYHLEGDPPALIKQTTIERFSEIVELSSR